MRNWFGTMDHHLATIGVRPLKSDPCIYVFEDDTGFVVPTLYVRMIFSYWARASSSFEMTDMDDVSRVLGTNVTRDSEKGTITIDQKDYTENIVERFGMKGCNPVFTPGAGPELSLNQTEKNLLDEEGKGRYQ